jgi:hypothetical protein
MSGQPAATTTLTHQDLAVLVQLAAVAAGPLGAPTLPDGWALISTFPGDRPPIPGSSGQGFVATGTFGDQSVTVLGLGLPWTSYLGMAPNPGFVLGDVAPPMVPAGGPQVETNLLAGYTGMRKVLWQAVTSAGGGPLYLTGLGLGGPLAQVAALDLRPGNKGPDGQPAPTTAPTVAVFSSPGPGNTAFATAFGQTQGANATTSLTGSRIAIDRFPLASTTAAGSPVVVPSLLPTPYDDPWLERGPGAYATALDPNGSWSPPETAPASLGNAPSGFDPWRASTCARLCAATYTLAQRPGLIGTLPIMPYTLQAVLSANGTVQGAVFASAMDVVVAFCGAITFQEFVTLLGNTFSDRADFIDSQFDIHAGARVAYTSGSPATIRDQLWLALSAIAPARPVYFAGHDLGGVVAVIAAADQLTNHKALGTPTVYGFGTCQMAGPALPSSPVYATLNAATFMIARTRDFLPRAPLLGSLMPFGQVVSLAGTPAGDEPTAHGISGYDRLLSPWA